MSERSPKVSVIPDTFRMIGFVSGICVLLIAGEVLQVQCKPKHFANENKHLYDAVHEHASEQYVAKKHKISEEDFKISGAEAKNVWMYIRSGTHTLRQRDIENMRKLNSVAKEVVAKFQNSDRVPFTKDGWNQLEKWNFDSMSECININTITATGKEELQSIAANYKKIFPALFTDNYSSEKFHILHSTETRSKQSMEIFFDEIFGQNGARHIEGANEEIVEAYAVYTKTPEAAKRPINKELLKFRNSVTFTNVVERIVKEFHFQVKDKSEKQELVLNIFKMCCYEEAWHPNSSVWCSFFKPDEIPILQYDVDLYNFYEWGFGFQQNYQIQCPTIRDMVESLGNGTYPVSAYFSHLPEITLHLVAMHVFPKHQMLTADNYNPNRVWQSKKLFPFAANFAAVLYDNQQVKFFMNEELMEISWCNNGVCNLNDLREQFSQCLA